MGTPKFTNFFISWGEITDWKLTGTGTVYFLAHFCQVAFSRQMIALKITLKKTHF
jgi:hypothetical protein